MNIKVAAFTVSDKSINSRVFILFCYKRASMLSPSVNNQVNAIEAFDSTLRYLGD